jgi:hypothetical protein
MAAEAATNTRTITIGPGESIILPDGVTVTSVILDGAISVESNCPNLLPPPTSYACGVFVYQLDVDENDSHSMDEENTYYQTLTIGDTTYDLSGIRVVTGENPGTVQGSSSVNPSITDQSLFSVLSILRTSLFDKRQYITMTFKAPLDLFDQIELSLYDRGIISYYKPTQVDCPDED